MSNELAHTRDHGYASIPPMTQREMQAFQYNMAHRLSPFQIRTLMAIDLVRRDVWAKYREGKRKEKSDLKSNTQT